MKGNNKFVKERGKEMKRFSILLIVGMFSLALCLSAFADNRLRVSGDNSWVAFVNGQNVGEGNDWQAVGVYPFELVNGGAIIAIYIHDAEPGNTGSGGALADIVLDNGDYYGSDETWKADAGEPIEQRKDGWETMGYDDSGWEAANQMDQFGAGIWGFGADAMRNNGLQNPDCTAYWIWAGPADGADDVYIRFTIPGTTAVGPDVKAAVTWGKMKLR
jgi:hypothetical protein